MVWCLQVELLEIKKKIDISSHFDFANKDEEYDIFLDASYQSLGLVLMQKGKIIAYAFYQLKDYET